MQDRRRLLVRGARGGTQFAGRREVAALRDPPAVEGNERGREPGGVVAGRLGRELGLEVPVAGRPEGDPLLLPVNHEPHGH
jgi:hypothetical protein